MKLSVAHLSKHRRTVTKIKDEFDNTLRYDVFILKGCKALDLPDGVDQIFKMQRLWYVNVAVQMFGLLIIDNRTDQVKINSYCQPRSGQAMAC